MKSMIDITTKIRCICQDNMNYMSSLPDKHYDWAIVDPPYFSGPEKRQYYGSYLPKSNVKRKEYITTSTWVVPQKEYFDELFRVSKNQIIFGCNYYNYHFGPGRIIWDKVNGESSFSDAEIAYCSAHDSVRLFRFMWNGMMQGKSIFEGHLQRGDKSQNQKRIHQCEKPIELYKWIFDKYVNIGEKVLDTHGGSMSIGIAAHDLGYNVDICELHPIHFENAVKRLKNYTAQMTLF
jgi:site-specific DNA-methyltransferase (adenine-specific)